MAVYGRVKVHCSLSFEIQIGSSSSSDTPPLPNDVCLDFFIYFFEAESVLCIVNSPFKYNESEA